MKPFKPVNKDGTVSFNQIHNGLGNYSCPKCGHHGLDAVTFYSERQNNARVTCGLCDWSRVYRVV